MKNTSLLHVVKISGLKPGTGYRYRVYAQEVLDHQGVEVTYGKVAATDVYGAKPLVFTTNDRHKPETSFAKLLQKSEMRKDIVIELSYKGFG